MDYVFKTPSRSITVVIPRWSFDFISQISQVEDYRELKVSSE